jgi:hypothetical protein
MRRKMREKTVKDLDKCQTMKAKTYKELYPMQSELPQLTRKRKEESSLNGASILRPKKK